MNKGILSKIYLFFVPSQDNNWRPKFLKGNFLIWVLVFLIISKLLIVSLFVYFPKTRFFADLTAAVTKTALVEMTNQERKTLGLNALAVNPTLERAAYLKAQDMMAKDYFAHYTPQGQTPWYWLKLAGYNYQYAGENLAIGFLDSEEVINAWNESPSHKQNLINPNYQEIGIAVLRGDFQGADATLVVQFLGSSQKAIPQLAKTPLESQEKEVKEPALSKEELPVSESEILPEQGPPAEEIPAAEGEPRQGREEISEKPVKEMDEDEITEIAGEEGLQLESARTEETKNGLAFFLFQFALRDYPDLLQKIIFYLLILVIGSLLLTIFVRFDIQDKNLILRTIALILILTLLVIFDKEIIIQLIPHNLII